MPEGDSLHRAARRLQPLVGQRLEVDGTIVRSRGQGDDNRTAYWCPGCQAGTGPPGE